MTTDKQTSRLAREYQRLYGVTGTSTPAGSASARALVLEVSRPAVWQPLGAVWQGVQADLGLPAPGIAVNGADALQLWFSLAEAIDAASGVAFLDALRLKYMAEVPLNRVATKVAAVPAPTPRLADANGQWAAFVASDLAALFEASPWLDMAPSEEGQADLLARLVAIPPAAFASALQQLQPQPESNAETFCVPAGAVAGPSGHRDAARFLLQVMNDPSAPLALRVEAAKALMPYRAP